MAITETNRRREIQEAFNEEHGITPQTIKKEIHEVVDTAYELSDDEKALLKAAEEPVAVAEEEWREMNLIQLKDLAKRTEQQMKDAASELAFEVAAELRDYLVMLRGHIQKRS